MAVLVFARSRANLKAPLSMRKRRSILGVSGGASLSMATVYSEKQVEGGTHPCLRPPLMGNRPESGFWWHTLPTIPSWKAHTK